MKKGFLIMLTLALLIGVTGISTMAMGMQRGPAFGMQALNLSVDQQKKILDIRQNFEKDTLSVRQALQAKQLEMRQLWTAKTLDSDRINAKTKEITDLRIQLVSKSRDMVQQIKQVLTPKQQKILDSMTVNAKNRFHKNGFGASQRKGFGQGRGCPGLGWGGNNPASN